MNLGGSRFSGGQQSSGRMWSYLALTACLVAVANTNPLVQTKYGLIEGKTLNTHLGKRVNRFHGVPFAKPPIGDLRWKPTQEPEPWEGVRKANTLNAACTQGQVGIIWLTHPGWSKYSEDCLYANIYAPNDTSNGPYAVMVWLHGGGYISSANVQYPGHFLAARDVVVVVPNYRIGALGFMATADDAARGNFGLLDQIQALKFVQENIAAFGGDPHRVTIFGQSAGAASSGLLSMSPRAEGLFHQAITESGSDQSIWGVNHPESHPENYTKHVARKFDCPTEDSYEMMDCMRKFNDTDIFDNSGFPCTPGFFCQGFSPVVDGEGGVIPQDPWTGRAAGLHRNISIMTGQCSEDGSMYTVLFIPESLDGGFNRTMFEHYLKKNLIGMFVAQFPDREQEVFEAINWYYSPWPYLDDKDLNRAAFNELITDFGWGFTGDIQVKSQSETSDVFYYNMGYRSDKAKAVVPEWMGVPHNGELPYVFGWPYLQKNFNIRLDSLMLIDLIQWDDEDIEWSDYITTMWTNFAKYGDPTPTPVKAPGNNTATKWKKFTKQEMNYLYLDRTIEDRKDFRQRSFALWTDYLPYVAGIDFIRPHQGPLTSNQSKTFGSLLDSNTIETRMNAIFKDIYNQHLAGKANMPKV